MWGEDWGIMLWGGAAIEQVPLGPWMLVGLGVLLGICAVNAHRNRAARIIPIVVALLVPVLVIATSELIVFQNGQVADATEVNANFAALETRIDDISGSFSKYEMVGSLSNGFDPVPIPAAVMETLCYDGDGCGLALNWNLFGGQSNAPAIAFGRYMDKLAIDGRRGYRSAFVVASQNVMGVNSSDGVDGDSSNEVVIAFSGTTGDCRVIDWNDSAGQTPTGGTDSAQGLWFDPNTNVLLERCVLTISD